MSNRYNNVKSGFYGGAHQTPRQFSGYGVAATKTHKPVLKSTLTWRSCSLATMWRLFSPPSCQTMDHTLSRCPTTSASESHPGSDWPCKINPEKACCNRAHSLICEKHLTSLKVWNLATLGWFFFFFVNKYFFVAPTAKGDAGDAGSIWPFDGGFSALLCTSVDRNWVDQRVRLFWVQLQHLDHRGRDLS